MGDGDKKENGTSEEEKKEEEEKKIKRKKRKKILNLWSTLLMEGLLNCIHCGKMRRRQQFQAGNTRSGTGVMIIGCCQGSYAMDTVDGRIFRMIRGSLLLMSLSRWTLGKETSWRSRISFLL